MPRFIFPAILVCLSSQSSPAMSRGDEKGHGGNVVLCKESQERESSTELLDFYEARVLRGLNFDLGTPNLTTQEKVNHALRRLDKFSPKRAERYRRQAREFLNGDAQFLRGIELGTVDDSDHVIVPTGCEVVQTAIQREPRFPNEKRYLVREDIWEKMTADHQAGLILHELIYRELDQPTSINARYFNSILCSRELEHYSLEEFLSLLRQAGFPSSDVSGLDVDLNHPFSLYSTGQLARAFAVDGSEFSLYGQSLRVNGRLGAFEFHESGAPKNMEILSSFFWRAADRELVLRFGLGFHANGTLAYGQIYPTSAMKFELTNSELELCPERDGAGRGGSGPIWFYANGQPRYLQFCRGSIELSGKRYPVEVGSDPLGGALVHANGRLESVYVFPQFTWVVQSRPVSFWRRTYFYPSGALLLAVPKSTETFDVAGRKVAFAANSYLKFAEDGSLLCGHLANETRLKDEGGKAFLYAPGTPLCWNGDRTRLALGFAAYENFLSQDERVRLRRDR